MDKEIKQLNEMLDAQQQMITLQLALFQERTNELKRHRNDLLLFLDEVYSIAKTAISLLLPLYISTFIYSDTIKNVSAVRSYLLIINVFLIVVIGMRLYFMSNEHKNTQPLHESNTEFLDALQSGLNSIVEIRTKQSQELANKLNIK